MDEQRNDRRFSDVNIPSLVSVANESTKWQVNGDSLIVAVISALHHNLKIFRCGSLNREKILGC
jgi:hypothetical protein